ncbi:MAG: hypothetical protein J6J58_02410 [Oscillospiraceae bacterium]|nr:hypothetical protein [Oscillospiraceae bacterium]
MIYQPDKFQFSQKRQRAVQHAVFLFLFALILCLGSAAAVVIAMACRLLFPGVFRGSGSVGLLGLFGLGLGLLFFLLGLLLRLGRLGLFILRRLALGGFRLGLVPAAAVAAGNIFPERNLKILWQKRFLLWTV